MRGNVLRLQVSVRAEVAPHLARAFHRRWEKRGAWEVGEGGRDAQGGGAALIGVRTVAISKG